jgi:ketosteroid isomerase-like protein
VSRENVDLLRRAWETLVTREPAGLDYLAEDVVFEVINLSPQAGTYHGHEGYRQMIREWTEVWGEFRIEAREFIDGGENKVIVVARASGRSRMTEIPYAQDELFYVYDVRGGKLARIRQVEDRATAFRFVAEETAR